MIVRTYDTGDGWTVEFSRGVQTFTLDYNAETEEEAAWMANVLRDFLYKYKYGNKPDADTENKSFSADDMEKAWKDGCDCGKNRGGMFDIKNYHQLK